MIEAGAVEAQAFVENSVELAYDTMVLAIWLAMETARPKDAVGTHFIHDPSTSAPPEPQDP